MLSTFFKMGAGLYAAGANWDYNNRQIEANYEALFKERAYNLSNFRQMMADTLASNKMSFYSSGLEHDYGTAWNVTQSNQKALQSEYDMMVYNYKIQEKNLEKAEKAAKRQLFGDAAKAITSAF